MNVVLSIDFDYYIHMENDSLVFEPSHLHYVFASITFSHSRLQKWNISKKTILHSFFFFFCEVFSCLSMYVISTLAIKIISTLYPPKYLNRYKSHVLVFLIFGLFIFYDLGSYGIVN